MFPCAPSSRANPKPSHFLHFVMSPRRPKRLDCNLRSGLTGADRGKCLRLSTDFTSRRSGGWVCQLPCQWYLSRRDFAPAQSELCLSTSILLQSYCDTHVGVADYPHVILRSLLISSDRSRTERDTRADCPQARSQSASVSRDLRDYPQPTAGSWLTLITSHLRRQVPAEAAYSGASLIHQQYVNHNVDGWL